MKIPRFATGIRTAVIAAATLAMTTGHGTAAEDPAPRKLPRGNRMFTIPCNTESAEYHLYRVDPVTAAFTSIGGTIDIEGSTCGYGMAYDRATRRSYFLSGNTSTGNWPLMRVNLKTGATTFVGDIRESGTPLQAFPAVAAVSSAGRGYVIVGNVLYKLNLKTGVAKTIGSTGVADEIYAFAFRPGTGRAYAVTEGGGVHRINLKTGHGTLLGTIPTDNGSVYSLQIDTKGTMWVNEGGSAGSGEAPRIGSFKLSDIEGSLIGSSAPMTFYSGAFLIAY